MAKRNDPQGQQPEAEKRTPVYTVVRLEQDRRLLVVKREQSAATQEKAMDAVVDALPESQRVGTFGAFLANSLRFKEYESETKVETKSKSVEVDLTPPKAPQPVE